MVDAHNSDMYHVKWSALGGIDSTVQLTPGKTTTPVLTIRFNANGGIVDSDTFSRDSGDYVTKNGTRDLTTWDLGYGHPSGLYNVGSFGLKRSGYSFVGWCMNKDGSSTIFDEDAFYLAETIYPNLKNGSAAITLYAIWAPNGFLSGMDGVYTMTPCHAQDMRLSVAENSKTSGANIRIESAGGTKNQIFRVTRVSDRSDVYTITAVSSNLQLNVEDGKGVYNTNVNQLSAQEGNAQRWAFSRASGADNAYYIRPMADPGLCLDVAGANTAAGTNVKIYFIHDNDAQKWILTPVQLGPDLTYIPARQPTCTQPGNIAYWTNDLDGMNYADENGSIELSDEEIFLPMLGHDYVTGMTAPSCTSQGFRTHTCSRCGESYNDSYVAALGHLWDNGTVIQAPTESESGYAQYLCTRCGSSRYEFLPALEHTHRYTAYVIEPTCTEQGYTTFTCTCGDSYTDAFVPALGHYFIGGVCIRCGSSEPEVQNRADTSGLDAAIAAAEELSRGDYTRDSLAVLDLALNNAIAVRNDLWASQAEVDAAAAALEHAMRSLEKLPAGEPFRFDDVKNEKAFYFTPVYWAYEAKPQITNGLDKTHFGPNAGCTRGQVVTFLWRAAGCPEPRSTRSPFTDVGSRAFYAKAVAWAVEKGITKGMSETSFAPDATCTRGQIVTFLWRFKGSPEPGSTATGFTDVSAKAFYAKAVAWAVENKVTNGMTKTTFAPNATCTRGQIVTFLYRAMNE